MPAPKDFIDAQVFSRGPTIVMRWSGERGWPAIFATPNCKEIFGVSAEDLVSGRRPYRDLVHPDDRRRVGLAIIETLKSNRDQIRHQDYRIVRPDGGIRYVQDFTVVQRRPDGWAEHFVGYIVDVTDRVQAAEQMRLSEERLKDFVESMSDWVWEQDADLRFTMVSTPGYQMLGRDIKGLLGKRREDLTDLEADPAEFRMHLADLAARRAFHDFRYKVHAPDGRVRHVSISGKPYFGPDGAFQGYRGVGRDISLQVEAENEKERLNRRMADAIESFSQPFILFDAEDRVVLANSRYCALVGVKEVRPGTP
ncbi:MAG: PAS domain S-box protein, partial [Alphaproteobacteria bacterium]|nr:PAS domain S-box protein [Alphaproteobacteria bacterium]